MITALVLAHVRVGARVENIQDQARIDVGGEGDDPVAAGREPGHRVSDHPPAELEVEDEHIRAAGPGQPGDIADDLGDGDALLRIRADPGDDSLDHDRVIFHDRDPYLVFQRASTHRVCWSR